MPRTAVLVKDVSEEETVALERHLAFGPPDKHRTRLAMQERGEATYLVAWLDGLPVGHLLLVWEGTGDEPMASSLGPCPDVEDLLVLPELRGRGIGTALLAAAEGQARQRGYPRIGLGVGTDNLVARSLYASRGYRESGLGEYPHCVEYVDGLGVRRCHTEICTYMVKEL